MLGFRVLALRARPRRQAGSRHGDVHPELPLLAPSHRRNKFWSGVLDQDRMTDAPFEARPSPMPRSFWATPPSDEPPPPRSAFAARQSQVHFASTPVMGA